MSKKTVTYTTCNLCHEDCSDEESYWFRVDYGRGDSEYDVCSGCYLVLRDAIRQCKSLRSDSSPEDALASSYKYFT